jgi:cell fate regulator YaaT (PSP1 superfamily)
MGCVSCSTGGCGSTGKKTKSGVSGCKSNGLCATGSCNKLNVFDWLTIMDLPSVDPFDIVEVRFKNGRKEFFRNTENIELYTGDPIIIEVPNGYHLGYVSLQGELVRLQMKRKKVSEGSEEIYSILRVATAKDVEKFEQTQERNLPTMYRTREIIREMAIDMKLSDVEYQADNTKATFYYSAEDRVDFRELIKLLASEFKIRVEMRQISLRQEASRLGGIGSCGRELCCATWLTEFKSVSTGAARYQNLSLNPSKLSGQCGRLKCCLNYELETYMEALEGIPEIETIQTKKGTAHLYKTDIFKKIMWFGYSHDSSVWHPVSVERVIEIIALNTKGIQPETFELNEIEVVVKPKQESRRNQPSHKKPQAESEEKSVNKKRNKRKNNNPKNKNK